MPGNSQEVAAGEKFLLQKSNNALLSLSELFLLRIDSLIFFERFLVITVFLGKYFIMNKSKIVSYVFVPLLAALFAFLPVQVTLCQAAETNTVSLPVEGHKGNVEKETAADASKDAVGDTEKSSKDDESSLSTGMMIGIGAGAAVLIGVAVAAGGGGGGGDAPVGPPTADQLVAAWHAEGSHPATGRTYSGTFHLYQGGALGYDIWVTDGRHLVGGGSWVLNGYQLQIRTDHGSLYSGELTPGVYTVIHLMSNTAWNLTLTR